MADIKRADVLTYLENANMIEVSELITEIEEKFGVTAAAPVVGAAPAAGGDRGLRHGGGVGEQARGFVQNHGRPDHHAREAVGPGARPGAEGAARRLRPPEESDPL